MQLGFITNALAGRPLGDIAQWAKENNFDYLEVGPHAPLNELEAYLSGPQSIPVQALLYCRNIRHPDESKRQEFLQATEARIDLAKAHNVPIVSISTGIDPARSLRANLNDSADALKRLCDRAGEGVTVAVENCPDTGNIAVNPEIWGELLSKVERPNFKLTYDPSHLIRLLIEPYESIDDFGPYIVHVHAKDAEVTPAKLARRGFLDEGWWRYRVPGWGQVDWRQVLTRLYEVAYYGGVSLEHEDPLFGGHHDGTVSSLERAEAGLKAGQAHLAPLLAAIRGGAEKGDRCRRGRA